MAWSSGDSLNSRNLNNMGGNIYNVTAYGATGDGTTDDTTAIRSAVVAAGTYGIVYFPPGTYLCSDLSVDQPMLLYGAGRSSVLYNTTSGTTTLSVRRTASSTTNRESELFGVTLRDLTLTSNRTTDVTGLWLQRLDHSTFDNLTFEAIDGPAIHFASLVRESNFNNITTRWCGGGATRPAILFSSVSGDGAFESHNAINFISPRIIYSHGPAVTIDTGSDVSDLPKTRVISFIGYQFHGLLRTGSDFDGTTPIANSSLTHDIVQLKSCRDVRFLNGISTAAGQGAAHFNISGGGDATSGATNISIRGARVEGHTAPSTGTVATYNSGVSLADGCQLYIDDSYVNATRDIVAASGSSLHLGANVDFLGTSSIDSTAYEPAQRMTGVFAPRPAESLILQGITRIEPLDIYSRSDSEPLRLSGQHNAAGSITLRTTNGTALTNRLRVDAGSAGTIVALAPINLATNRVSPGARVPLWAIADRGLIRNYGSR